MLCCCASSCLIGCVLPKRASGGPGVILEPGASQTLMFNLPEPVAIATVTLDGDRVFHPGDYTVRFSRGHGDELTKVVTVKGSAPLLVKKFPSRWVVRDYDRQLAAKSEIHTIILQLLLWSDVQNYTAKGRTQ